ncbi:MAG: divalent-cation tolerance protein CutA [Deltaproteobacteria bacterium]|nr:divalent-cation tolerance protein CutA [Deltaproteobacteria bacterium]
MTIQITTTADKKQVLEEIAKKLLEERLIGCAQIIGPVKSIYWWEGKIVEEEEFLCFMKTKAELFDAVKDMIKDLHPYEVPEIIGIKAEMVSRDYELWLENETKNKPND